MLKSTHFQITRLAPRLVQNYSANAKQILLQQDKSKIVSHDIKKSDLTNNRVYVWGFQETGALGLQTNVKKFKDCYTEMVHYPSRLQFSVNNEVTDVAAGYGFTAFAVNRSDGHTLFGCGLNTDSQLGFQAQDNLKNPSNADIITYPSAIQLPRDVDDADDDMQVRCMSAGRAHLVVVTRNGMIFTMGSNSYGQCGRIIIENEKYHNSALIHRIPQSNICGKDDEIVEVECGQDHTMFLSKLGRVYSCGWGADGQTGKGTYNTSGQIDLIGGDIANQRIIKLSSSSDSVLALNEHGELFGWGNSEYGQLDNSPNAFPQINTPRVLTITKRIGKIKDIAAGGSFCMILNEQGLVYTWGFGILGFGPTVEQTSKPQPLLPQLFGRNDFSNKTKVVSIGCGIFHMSAINSDGDLFMWGKNRFGHLGLGHKQDQFFPFKAAINGKVSKVAFGADHTVAIWISIHVEENLQFVSVYMRLYDVVMVLPQGFFVKIAVNFA